MNIDECKRFKIRAFDRKHADFIDCHCKFEKQSHEGLSDSWYFIQAADTQLGLIDRYIKKLKNPGWLDELESCKAIVTFINESNLRPKFIVICGDLTDSRPTDESNRLRNDQIQDFKKVFVMLNIPLVCVCGNHDIGEKPTLNSLKQYKTDFGDDYYHLVVNEVLFLVINSQFYKHCEFVKDYAKAQDDWLEEMLKMCKSYKHTIVFQHIPLFVKHADEDDLFCNIKLEKRIQLLTKFKEAGVSKIMCGHYHQNGGGFFDESLEVVVTSAIGAQFGSDKSGIRLVKINNNDINHKYFTIDELKYSAEIVRSWIAKEI